MFFGLHFKPTAQFTYRNQIFFFRLFKSNYSLLLDQPNSNSGLLYLFSQMNHMRVDYLLKQESALFFNKKTIIKIFVKFNNML
ncbi:hypothetical protein NEIFLAOT_01965 [Neisseria flavescens NRL30031/H210]|uniref:Uncharacterized protein n=1 Tax=Neisseria flavescens NRL30031/H210 TaxID=546264 RepID=C0EPS5_NEIFL|nr:hypothetical protein NEIFLAOT_01965 [Neisseria flavescens NRL30031/H210]